MSSNVYELISNYIRNIPVQLDSLFQEAGIGFTTKPLGEDVFGCLKRLPDGKFEITVNSSNSVNRRRFTAAHELGHFVLHRHLLGNGVSDNTAYRSVSGSDCYNSNITAKHETEANMFAASVLMPTEALIRKWNSGVRDVPTLSKEFQVSESAMEIRLRSLGLR